MTKLKTVQDQMDETVTLPFPPKRIISLVPSQTELLYHLGLDDAVVGTTKFCVMPQAWQSKPKVGGTKKFWFDKIDLLQPDLIIGNKEENYADGINELKNRYPVWMSDVVTIADARGMMLGIGEITDRLFDATQLVDQIERGLGEIPKFNPFRTLYLIWHRPWMAVAAGTFINSMMGQLGFKNVLAGKFRYPKLSASDISELKPELILLSSEPFPFNEKQANELRHLLPDAKIVFVDGMMMSWYGSRMLHMKEYCVQLLAQLSS